MRCRRVPLHLGFVLEPETRRIRPRRIRLSRWKTDEMLAELGGDEWWWRWRMTGLSKREPKVCYWTEGVPSVEKTGFGRKMAAEVAEWNV